MRRPWFWLSGTTLIVTKYTRGSGKIAHMMSYLFANTWLVLLVFLIAQATPFLNTCRKISSSLYQLTFIYNSVQLPHSQALKDCVREKI